MGKYLKKFENHTQYENARQNLILPNVSLCAQENDVHYNPYPTPPSLKWRATGDDSMAYILTDEKGRVVADQSDGSGLKNRSSLSWVDPVSGEAFNNFKTIWGISDAVANLDPESTIVYVGVTYTVWYENVPANPAIGVYE